MQDDGIPRHDAGAASPSDSRSGLALARRFFHEAVAPILERIAPGARYTAGRLGTCSDVIGFDDAISRDHGWGPACTVLIDLATPDVPGLDAALRGELPRRFLDCETNFDAIALLTPAGFLRSNLGIAGAELGAIDWLAIDEQRLLEVTSGELFRDDLGFERIRRQLAFYPDDLRRHLMAVEWTRILEEQAFPGRAGSRGDDIGSGIVAMRLVENAIRLGFYLERTYPPYAKWFGSAFKRLACSAVLQPPIARLLAAQGWKQRDVEWAELMRRLITLHEDAGLIEAGKYRVAPVYAGRPGSGLPQLETSQLPTIGQLIAELRRGITDPEVLALPHRVGSINQLVANRDLEEDSSRWRAWFRAMFTGHLRTL